jgi:G:T-mismatch repair DNA endonuclease (very short patch repair protein)
VTRERDKKKLLICTNCNNEYVGTTNKRSKNNFCSKSCGTSYRHRTASIIEKCVVCESEFAKKHRLHVTCSEECLKEYSKKQKEARQFNYICEQCDKTFVVNYPKKGNHVFCSKKCNRNYRHEHSIKEKNCKYCGKSFTLLNHDNFEFCSRECINNYRSKTYVGENSPTYNHDIPKEERVAICQNCKKEFLIPSFHKGAKAKFCSKRCAMIGMLDTLTKPHVKTCDILLDSNISEFIVEYKIDRYWVDIFIDKFNLAIEVMGAYWHCDNRLYKKPKNDKQERNIEKDRRKKKTIEKEIGSKILYLWEEDINKRPDVCKNLILKYVESNGKLDNYHSMNYILDGEFKLSNHILIPYFES